MKNKDVLDSISPQELLEREPIIWQSNPSSFSTKSIKEFIWQIGYHLIFLILALVFIKIVEVIVFDYHSNRTEKLIIYVLGLLNLQYFSYWLKKREQYWLLPQHLIIKKGIFKRMHILYLDEISSFNITRLEDSSRSKIEILLKRKITNPFFFYPSRISKITIGSFSNGDKVQSILLKQKMKLEQQE